MSERDTADAIFILCQLQKKTEEHKLLYFAIIVLKPCIVYPVIFLECYEESGS